MFYQPSAGLEYVTEVQVTGHHPRYECSLCDAKFEHDVKFPHLVGQKHRMNVLVSCDQISSMLFAESKEWFTLMK
jgi:hypothetical protein